MLRVGKFKDLGSFKNATKETHLLKTLSKKQNKSKPHFKGEPRYCKRLKGFTMHGKLLSGNNSHSFRNYINSSNLQGTIE